MNKFAKVICWIAFPTFMSIALVALFNGGLGILAALLFIVGGLLVAPFDFARRIRLKLKKPLSICLIVALFIVGCLLVPTTETPDIDDTSSSIPSSTTADLDSSINSSSNISEDTNTSESDNSENSTSSETSNESVSHNSSTTSNISSIDTNQNSSQDNQENIHTHNYSNATCTTPKTCSGCGATVGTANGHSWKNATYSAPKTCTVCGATEGVSLTVPGQANYHGHVYTGGSSSKRFHYEAHCAGSNSHEITWDEVTRRGLTACGTCVLK